MKARILPWLVTGLISGAAACADNQPPLIDHVPVTLGVHGQNLVLRAHVTDDSMVRSVTLHYTASRDAAPFRLAMEDTGTGVYMALLRPELFAGLTRLFYYIEAKDDEDAVSETPWYTVEFRSPTPEGPGTAPAAPGAPSVRRSRSRWFWPSVAAGGVVLGGTGIALALHDGNGGDSGTGTPPPSTNGASYAGTYVGAATTCVQPPNGTLSCAQSAVTLTISADGLVSSDDLVPGTHLEAPLSGLSFVLTHTVSETNRVGNVFYTGTLVGPRVLGTIQGTVNMDTGTETYSGNFTAVRM